MNASSFPTKINEILQRCTKRLEDAGIGTARLDCLVLLEDITGKERGWLLAHPEYGLNIGQKHSLDQWITRREKHEPLAYIRGKTEFYGREFFINNGVLEPRPESETMVELLLEQVKSLKFKVKSIIDVGTGSGALAITAKLQLPAVEVAATDIDPKCLTLARKNAKKHAATINFFQGDLLDPLRHSAFIAHHSIILANLPYVPDDYQINKAALMEPRQAIFGGPDGLNLYRNLFQQAADKSVSCVLTESLPFQHNTLATIAKNNGYIQLSEEDFIQVFEKQ